MGRQTVWKPAENITSVILGIEGAADASELIGRIIQGTNHGNPQGHYTRLASDGDKLVIYDDRSSEAAPVGTDGAAWLNWRNSGFNVKASDRYGKFGPGTAYSVDDTGIFRNPATVALQIGAQAGQVMLTQANQYGQGVL